MALLGLGLGLGRGLLSLAGVAFVFYLGRKVQHFERRVLELQEEKEELKDLHTEVLQQAEQIKESFYVAEVQKSEYEVLHQETSEALFFAQLQNVQLELRENELGRNVEALEKQVQGLKVDNENLLELYRTVFQGGEIMKEKLFLAEKQVEEYAILNIEASKDFELLQSQKKELESSLDSALQKLQRKQEEIVASKTEKSRLELFLNRALEKLKKTEGEVDALLTEKTHLENYLVDVLGKPEEKRGAFEAYTKEVEIFKAVAFGNVPEGSETEARNLTVEAVADGNNQLQKRVKEQQCRQSIARSCDLQNHTNLPAIHVPTTAPSLGESNQAPRPRGFNRMMEHELTKHYQGDERSLPQSEISKNGKVKATGSSISKYHVAEAPSETSNGRRRLAPDRITSLKDLVRSCVRQGSEKRK